MRLSARHAISLAITLVFLGGCGRQDREPRQNENAATRSAPGGAAEKIKIVATTSIVADLARNIGGDLVEVTSLMGPGVDPHLYRARAGDVSRLSSADLVLYHGLHLEASLADVLRQMGERVTTAAVAEGIERDRLIISEAFGGSADPHIWFDVRLWMEAAERARDALARRDPGRAGEYAANTERYLTALRELDEYVRQQAETVPPQQRVLVTAHDAFNYFGRAYGFEVEGLQGISTASEAGIVDVQRLATLVAEREIKAIFVETSVPLRSIEAVQAAAGTRGWDVAIGGSLYSDALGAEGTPGGTYLGMIRHNIDAITGALRK